MKQALHIFKKDVCHLRYDLVLNMLVVLAFCLVAINNVRGPESLGFVLPIVWWFLIARVIHAEPLPGKRQFWLTRPYGWRSLLGAKLLFIFVFINLPLFIADTAIIYASGFSVVQQFAGLLWTQVLLVAAFILPAAAVAAVTDGLAELLVATLLLILIALARLLASPLAPRDAYWMESEWLKNYYLIAQIAACAAVILIWQYARRRTFATRMLAGAAALMFFVSAALLPWNAAFAVETRLSKRHVANSFIRIKLDANRKWLGRIYASEKGQVVAELPLEISGLPVGAKWKPNGLTITLHAADGEIWISQQPPSESFEFQRGITLLEAQMSKGFYIRVKDQPLRLVGTLYFTLYGNEQTTPIPLNSTPVYVNGVGLCSAGPRYLLCNSPFRPRSAWATFLLSQDIHGRAETTIQPLAAVASYSPFPAAINIDPVNRLFSLNLNPISAASIDVWQPFAHLKRNFEIDDVRLTDFTFSK